MLIMVTRIFVVSLLAVLTLRTSAAEPIRVLVAGSSNALRADFTTLLNQRGAVAKAISEGNDAQTTDADVIVVTGPLPAEARGHLESFAKRGGGIVAIHGDIAGEWWRPVVGGAWIEGTSKRFSSRMMLYVSQDGHPIVDGASAFDITDETLYDLDLEKDVRVLGSAFTPKITGGRKDGAGQRDRANIYDIQPQMWAFEATDHRAFVALQGSVTTLQHPSFRAFVLRAVAWTAKRENADALCTKSEINALRYPKDGPSAPAKTIKQFDLPPGFSVSVVASEPLITKPIAANWDARGRLWIAETPEYPNGRRPGVAEPWKETGVLKPGTYDRPATDRISILEDTDGDGVMDKKTIFHEGLELVTGFCFHKDGVIVLHEPDIVWLRDTDGDDKADKVERLYTGFTPGDTHFVANHLIPAPDGWIYASMGGDADVRSLATNPKMIRVTSGVFRFKPDGSAIEQFSSKGGNGFGLDITSDGEVFFGQATSGNPVQHVVLPEATLARGKLGTTGGAESVIAGRKVVRETMPDRAPLMQIDTVGGYSAACASLIYEGGTWPLEYARGIFCTEPILNVIHHERLVPKGPTFSGAMVPPDKEFLFSHDYWFRPFELAPGPDGAVYILDFYTPVVAHSDSRGPQHSRAGASVRPDRDHYFGRVYRVQYDGAPQAKTPDLSKLDADALAKAFSHPNRTIRNNAFRLLVDRGRDDAGAASAMLNHPFTPARILALWALQRVGALEPATLYAAFEDVDPTIRKTAALIAETNGPTASVQDLTVGLADADVRTRLVMLRALGAKELNDDSARALVAFYPSLDDRWSQSAAVATAASNPTAILAAALHSDDAPRIHDFLAAVAEGLVEKHDLAAFEHLIAACADAPFTSDSVKRVLIEAAAHLNSPFSVTPENVKAVSILLTSANPEVSTAALPIASKLSQGLRDSVKAQLPALLSELNEPQTGESRKMQIAEAVIGARNASDSILPAISSLLVGNAPGPVKRHVIATMSAAGDSKCGATLVSAFGQVHGAEQDAAFNAILTRPEWTTALLDAVEGKQLSANVLGPSNAFRLRTHPSKAVATRSAKLLDSLRKTSTDKDALIAQLLPMVTRAGDPARGGELFSMTCAVCHRFKDIGNDVGPVLTGMGAHGPGPLLTHIVDPNRAVDAGYEVWNIEMKDDQFQAGILATENDARLVLKMPGAQVEVPKDRIKARTNTHRSLMPEGFEALGAEPLRDLIAFLCQGSTNYRVLDLSSVFSADTRRGLFESAAAVNDTLRFKRFGIIDVDGIPFDLADPAKSLVGGNLIVLKGGGRQSFANTFPQRVDIKVGVAAKALHFLGGVAGWGAAGPKEGKVIMKATLTFSDGSKQEAEFRDGVEFIDYVSEQDVPGSTRVDGVTRDHQVRRFSIPVKHDGATVDTLTLESPGEGQAATTVAITAEL